MLWPVRRATATTRTRKVAPVPVTVTGKAAATTAIPVSGSIFFPHLVRRFPISLCVFHFNLSSVVNRAIQLADGSLCFVQTIESDVSKSTRPPGVVTHRNVNVVHGAVAREQLPQVVLSRLLVQSLDEERLVVMAHGDGRRSRPVSVRGKDRRRPAEQDPR